VPAAADDGKGNKATPNEGYWPADWRETVSKDDAKMLGRLGRYASPEAAMQALIAAQNRISAGELKPVLGKNPTADQLKEFREANGIPETPDKYDLGDMGKTLSKDAVDLLLAEAHATNQTPAQVQASLKAYNSVFAKAMEMRHENDVAAKQASEDALRAEWGPEFRRNLNLVHGLLDGNASQPLKNQVLGARLPDGTLLGSSPEVLKLLVSLALVQNPSGVVVPGSEANPLQGVEDEIGKIEKAMRENRTAYNKDEKMQARYRELLGAREQMKPRAKA